MTSSSKCRNMVLLASLMFGCAAGAYAQDGSQGIIAPTVFPKFNPGAASCSKPPGLDKTLAFVQENEREFLQGVDYGLEMAAKDRGLKYRKISVNNDSEAAAQAIQSLRTEKVGAVIATSSDPAAVTRSLQEFIWSGGYVGTIVPPPATLLLNAPQYATGKELAEAAIAYINTRLGGKANVVLLTQDSMQFLTPRFVAMRDGLSELPGVTIIADIAPNPVSKQGGFDTMKSILLAEPHIDVVLGGDAVVLGALEALRATGNARADQFLGGIDGEPEAVREIKTADSPYKASIALSSPVFGYAMGQFGADWLDGKSIPQAMDILPIALTSTNIAQYETDLLNPALVFADATRRDEYLNMYGNTCYDQRDNYVNFPWSSEQD